MQHNKVSFDAFASANHLSCISYCCIKHFAAHSPLSCSHCFSIFLCIFYDYFSLSLSLTHIVTTYRKAFCSPQTSIRFQCSIFNSFATKHTKSKRSLLPSLPCHIQQNEGREWGRGWGWQAHKFRIMYGAA